MIKTDFYPGVVPFSGVDLEWTNTVTNLSQPKSVEPFKAYYMGTTPVPYLKIGTFTRTGDSADNYVYHIAVDNARSVNRWFYAAKQTGISGTRISCTGTVWDGTYRLLNKFKPYYYNHLRSVSVSMTMYDYTSETTLSNGEHIRYTNVGYNNSNTISLGQDDIYNIFNGSGDITATFDGVTYHITLSMWDDTVHAFYLGGTKYAFVTSIDDGSAAISPTPGRNGVYFNNTDLRFCVFTSIDLTNFTTSDNWYFGKCFLSNSNHSGEMSQWELRTNENKLISPSMLYNGATYRPVINDDICGWFYDADISQVFFNWLIDHNGIYALNAQGTPAQRSGWQDIKLLWGVDFPAWFKCCYGAIPKDRTNYDADGNAVTPVDNSPFYESYNAVPVFSGYNTFKFRTKRKTYDDLSRLLQNWQKYGADISDDDYNPDNPPEPTPTPRPDRTDPGIEENDGADITLPIPSGVGGGFGFLTQYAIDAGQLQEIGLMLWKKLFDDADFYKNVMYALSNTGSINMSSIMSMFVSLRVYPFPLVNLSSWQNVGTDFYFGASVRPIPMSDDLHIINDFVGYIDAGTLTIPAYFADFRDYEMEIELYLPYCGTAQLNPGDVVGAALECHYLVDFCTGSCTAYVSATTYDDKTFPVAIIPGTIGADVPMTATNSGQIASRIGSDVLNFTQTITHGITGIGHGFAGIAGRAISGDLTGALNAGLNAWNAKEDTIINVGKQAADIMGRGAVAAPMLSSGRGFSSLGNAATAYVQIRFSDYPTPDNYNNAVGFPCSSAVRVGDCSGFCQFVNVDTTELTADVHDQQRIKKLLENGIYI